MPSAGFNKKKQRSKTVPTPSSNLLGTSERCKASWTQHSPPRAQTSKRSLSRPHSSPRSTQIIMPYKFVPRVLWVPGSRPNHRMHTCRYCGGSVSRRGRRYLYRLKPNLSPYDSHIIVRPLGRLKLVPSHQKFSIITVAPPPKIGKQCPLMMRGQAKIPKSHESREWP